MAFNQSSISLSAPVDNTVVILNRQNRDQAIQGALLTEAIQTLYSLVLYDTERDAILVSPGLDPANRTTYAEYFFTVPPKVHEFDEPFATTITNTQDAGKYVESYGSIIKSVRVSGSTGFRPNKSSSPVLPILGITADQISTLLGSNLNSNPSRIPRDEITGYDDIMFLRNIFRRYSDIKLSNRYAGSVVMLWRNIKDADYWVVEPEDFKISQSSGSPLTYEYSISLKTLARFDFSYTISKDPLEATRSRQRLLARLQAYNQNLLNIFLTVSNQINRIQGYAVFMSNTILAPVLNILNGLSAIRTSGEGLSVGLENQARTLDGELDAAIKKLTDPTNGTKLPAQHSIFNSLQRLKITLANILSEPTIASDLAKNTGAKVNSYARAYLQAGTVTTATVAPTASLSYIGYEPSPGTVGATTVYPGEDIRDVASRLLGDRGRWKILVTLNGLTSPFISPTGGPGVLMPGDTILYPADKAFPVGSLTVDSQNLSSEETKNNSQANTPVQAAYGRDLALQSTFIAGDEITDLVINQRGDLGSIVGIPNIEQAVRVKFITGRGELPAHSTFGAKFPIGSKASPSSFNEFRLDALRTILSDTRVTNVSRLDFLATGDTLALTTDIVITDSQNVLSTSFALRRF